MRSARSSVLLLIAVLLMAESLPRESRAESRDQQLIAGLRDRRLFELAERFCQSRLGNATLDETTRTEITVELLRTLALHAIHDPAVERAQRFQQAHSVASDFARKKSIRGVPVQLQDALTWLVEGELAAAEYRAGVLTEADLDRVLTPLRTASTTLEQIDRQLTKEIPLLRRRPPQTHELSADELFSLQQHALHQWARVSRIRAELYPPKSADRIALAQQAQEMLKAPSSQLLSDEPLAQQVRLEQAISERLLGNFQLASEILTALDREFQPAELRLSARAERIRTALDAQDLQTALQLQHLGRELAGRVSPDLDLAWLETAIAAWKLAEQQTNAADVQAWQDKAAAIANFLQQTHGAYWGRRGDQLLVSAIGKSTRGGGAAVLSRMADNFYRQGKVEQAAATYEKASEQAFTAGDVNMGFELAFKGAIVQQECRLFADSARRLRALSLREPKHPQAPIAHLQSVVNAAQEVRRNPNFAATYVESLQEHLTTWPSDETSAQAALWLGQWHSANGNHREAADNRPAR